MTAGWCGASWRPAATPTASTPAPASSTRAELGTLDLRGEPVAEHLRAVAAAGLGAVVLSGMVEGMAGGERGQLLSADRDPAGPGRDAGRPLGDPAGLGGRRRAGGGRPRGRPAAAARGLVQAPGAGRVRGRRAGRARTGADFLVIAVRADIISPYAPASGERRRRGAGGRAPVHRRPQPARRHGDPYAACCATPCARPAGARRSSPRRSTTTWPPRRTSTGCTPSTRRGRRGHLPVHDVVGRGGLPGRARAAADPRLPQLHRPRVLRRLGAQQRAAGGAGGRRAGAAGPRGAARAGQEPLQRAGAPAGRLPAHRGRAGPGRLPAGSPRAPIRGWRRSWPGSRADGGADILFVGRVVPSKAQHELVKALWAYRRLYDPKARLHLVGGTSSFEYNKALHDFVHDLGLSAAVRLPARCRTRRWPPTSLPPTSTCRCPRTRDSACRWSRRWWPGCPS